MKPLIYTMAWGDDYFYELAALLVRRLRSLNYLEDVLVLTDRDAAIEGAATLDVSGGDGYFRLRVPEGYDRYLCLDSDIYVGCLYPLLYPQHFEGFMASHEPILLSDCGFNHLFLRGSPMEGWAVNAGTFLVSGKCRGDVFAAWNSYSDGYNERHDQAALQAAITHGKVISADFGCVGFPFKGEMPKHPAAIHLNGIERHRWMIPKILSALEAAGGDG